MSGELELKKLFEQWGCEEKPPGKGKQVIVNLPTYHRFSLARIQLAQDKTWNVEFFTRERGDRT